MLKNIQQKLTGNQRIQLDTGSYILSKLGVFFQNDQSTGLCFSHLKGAFHQLVDGLVAETFFCIFFHIKRYQRRKELLFAKLFQSPPQLRLKNNGRCHKDRIDAFADQKQNGIQVQKCGNKDKNNHDQDALHQSPRPGVPDPDQDVVHYKGKYDDLQHIGISKRKAGKITMNELFHAHHDVHVLSCRFFLLPFPDCPHRFGIVSVLPRHSNNNHYLQTEYFLFCGNPD